MRYIVVCSHNPISDSFDSRGEALDHIILTLPKGCSATVDFANGRGDSRPVVRAWRDESGSFIIKVID